jgi:triacylglycerol esterase/lipase EstA (alpha/beta hydrolase family)
MVRSLSPRRRLFMAVLAGLLLAAAAGLGAIALSRSGPVPAAAGGRVPVLLVHGYDGSPGSFSTLAPRLRADGHDVVLVSLPLRGRGDLRESARALDAAVRRTGAAQVDVVAHSAGGIVTRLWLTDLGGLARARHVVMLGTPNHGTTLAEQAGALGPESCAEACAELVPGSSLLAGLNRGDETPAGPVPGLPTWTSIWTERDQVVTPAASASLEGALDLPVQGVCPDAATDHSGLTRDPLVLSLVTRALDGRLDEVPGRGECARLRSERW